MKYLTDLTQDYLKLILHYDPTNGLFKWIYPRPKVQYGDVAGCVSKKGYVIITIDGKKYKASRLAWLYMTGAWPEKDVDHNNTLKQDNSWDNLREAEATQNNYNYAVKHTNQLGVKGVYFYRGMYRAQIQINKVKLFLGQFNSLEEAKAAHDEAANKYQGEFVHSSIAKGITNAS